MNDKADILQIFGCLMKNPLLLSKTDKYTLNLTDFTTRFEKYIFDAISVLYQKGVKRINPIDIENYLSSNEVAIKFYNANNGREYLQDAEELSEENNFDYYYTHFKKLNALKSLKKIGIDISEFYCDDPSDKKYTEINSQFEKLSITDIMEKIKKKILNVEHKFLKNDVSETRDIFSGLDILLESSESGADIGLPLQGDLMNEVMGGARKGTFCLRSGGSGLGKSRGMVADACFIAFPFRFNPFTMKWEQKGNSEKVLYITTEQNFDEIQRMVLAYLTGINESKFRYGKFSDLEKKIIQQARQIMMEYKDNFQITKMPNPTNELIKTTLRENYILYGTEYIFYDYIFIGPALLNEFRGYSLRSDELLLILSTTLKDIASELNVFVMSGTQVNAKSDENKDIRNEASLAGGRATINKADYGFIMARPTKEELELIKPFTTKYGKEANLVFDVYKVRAGQWTQVRIWSVFDAGILRKEDLFMTDSRCDEVDMSQGFNFQYENWEDEEYAIISKKVKELNEGLL